jgi:hypothetical protein
MERLQSLTRGIQRGTARDGSGPEGPRGCLAVTRGELRVALWLRLVCAATAALFAVPAGVAKFLGEQLDECDSGRGRRQKVRLARVGADAAPRVVLVEFDWATVRQVAGRPLSHLGLYMCSDRPPTPNLPPSYLGASLKLCCAVRVTYAITSAGSGSTLRVRRRGRQPYQAGVALARVGQEMGPVLSCLAPSPIPSRLIPSRSPRPVPSRLIWLVAVDPTDRLLEPPSLKGKLLVACCFDSSATRLNTASRLSTFNSARAGITSIRWSIELSRPPGGCLVGPRLVASRHVASRRAASRRIAASRQAGPGAAPPGAAACAWKPCACCVVAVPRATEAETRNERTHSSSVAGKKSSLTMKGRRDQTKSWP